MPPEKVAIGMPNQPAICGERSSSRLYQRKRSSLERKKLRRGVGLHAILATPDAQAGKQAGKSKILCLVS